MLITQHIVQTIQTSSLDRQVACRRSRGRWDMSEPQNSFHGDVVRRRSSGRWHMSEAQNSFHGDVARQILKVYRPKALDHLAAIHTVHVQHLLCFIFRFYAFLMMSFAYICLFTNGFIRCQV